MSQSMHDVARENGTHTYDVQQEQTHRQRISRETCHKYHWGPSRIAPVANRFWINETAHALYCIIPKVGTKNWRKMFRNYTQADDLGMDGFVHFNRKMMAVNFTPITVWCLFATHGLDSSQLIVIDSSLQDTCIMKWCMKL